MAGKKSYEEPDRGRGTRETPGRDDNSSSEGGRDRDFGEREKNRHENPMKPGERSPREPRT